jgi:hypothetical protein
MSWRGEHAHPRCGVELPERAAAAEPVWRWYAAAAADGVWWDPPRRSGRIRVSRPRHSLVLGDRSVNGTASPSTTSSVIGAAGLSCAFGCPTLDLLVTSHGDCDRRRGVHSTIAQSSDARALFVARTHRAARGIRARSTKTLQPPDDLPLALELAAARTTILFRTAAGASRAAARPPRGGRDADTEAADLRATIEWSYDLSVRTSGSCSRPAVFEGGRTLGAESRLRRENRRGCSRTDKPRNGCGRESGSDASSGPRVRAGAYRMSVRTTPTDMRVLPPARRVAHLSARRSTWPAARPRHSRAGQLRGAIGQA